MSSNSRKQRKDFFEFFMEKEEALKSAFDKKGKDMERDTMVWLCRALAAVAGIVALLYLALVFTRITI